MISVIVGTKIGQSQVFLEDGRRTPVTTVRVPATPVVHVKTLEKDRYIALQVGLGTKRKQSQTLAGQSKKAHLQQGPAFLREIRLDSTTSVDELPKVGEMIQPADVLKPGDIVQVTGTSKGKGFAGGVKRHGFRGGPRTHGQSDRERAPGSIGQTTTPGRVYKGKRMAGHMGHERVTIKNLMVIDITGETLSLDGLVPGIKDSLLMIKKVGESKHFVPVFKLKVEEPTKADAEIASEPQAEASIEAPAVETPKEVKSEVTTDAAADTKVEAAPEPAQAEEKTDEKSVEEAPAAENVEVKEEDNGK